MKRQWTLLRSRVERQLFALFLSCAVAPVVALSIVSFDHLRSELYEQNRIRYHRASKATGMLLAARIADLDAELTDLIASTKEAGVIPSPDDRFGIIEIELDRSPMSRTRAELNTSRQRAAEEAHLRGGKTLLRSIHEEPGFPRVVLERMIEMDDARARVTAEIDSDDLFDISHQNTLPPLATFCVFDDLDRALSCSGSGDPSFTNPEDATSGQFEWSRDGEPQIAYFWSLFLKPNYHSSHWTIVLSQSKSSVLAPIAGFQISYASVVASTVVLISLLCVSRIRKRLVPLKQLGEGARRVGDGDFSVEVTIDSGDEFEELGHSFNVMATRLSQQFESLETMIGIDRAILSAIDRDKVVDTFVRRVPELLSCDAVALTLVDPGPPKGLRTQFEDLKGRGRRVVQSNPFTAADLRQLESNPEISSIDLRAGVPQYLKPHAEAGIQACRLLPLMIGGEIAGVASLGHTHEVDTDARIEIYARQLANQTATALANVKMIEENRALAYYDRLTGLPNRLLFQERLNQAVESARRRSEKIATLLFGLDSFKKINDTLGNDTGDELLQQVASRISEVVPSANIARLDGDEFGMLLTDLGRIDDLARFAKRVLDSLAGAFSVRGHQLFLAASIGISIFPDDGAESDALLRSADVAMQHAKERSGGSFQFYTSTMNATASRSLELEGSLRQAVDNGELEIYFQPIVDVESRLPVSAEALARWNNPRLGMISPDEFIPLAEEIGIIGHIGKWILETTCSQVASWHAVGFPLISVSVNLSGRQFDDDGLLHIVRRVLDSSNLRPDYLVLELTEGIMLGADEQTLNTLHTLREIGVKLSIDDFGTGYSSFSYLKNFPLDYLKIDRSFLKDVTRSEHDAAVTTGIITMAHSLGLRVVGEGVETEEQLAFLRAHRCESAQGFLFAEPLSIDAFRKYLEQQNWE